MGRRTWRTSWPRRAIVIGAGAAHKLIDDRQMTPQLPDEMKRIAELKKGWPRAA